MSMQVRCPSCGRTYPFAGQPGERSARCHGCAHKFRVKTIDRYQILEEIGRGGFGVVYRVFDPKMDREAAVKVLHAEIAQQDGSAEALHRFRNEAKLLAQIVHPNILPLYEAGEHEGRLYLVMALIRGQRLDALISPQEPLDPRRAVTLVLPLLEALHYVHSAYGICHRDIKPANIMVGEGDSIFLMDFGLAVCRNQDATRITTTGTTLGTPAYMPPEQAEGDLAHIGPWSDQYSAGVVLFHLLTGQVPFRKALPAILTDIISTPPPAPSSLRPELGREIDRIVLKALAKNPRSRYRDCREFADLLRGWSSRYTKAATDGGSIPSQLRTPKGRHVPPKLWILAIAALLMMILLATGAYFLFWKKAIGPGHSPTTPTTVRKGEKRIWEGD